MATYIESALADFIKTILTRGIRTLKSPRFLPYTLVLLIVVITSTVFAFLEDLTSNEVGNDTIDLLLFVELAAALTFIITGLFFGRVNVNIQLGIMVVLTAGITFFLDQGNEVDLATDLVAILYIVWIIIASFSTFALFRDMFANKTIGTILFLGKPEDDGAVMFGTLAWLLAFINLGLGYTLYTQFGDSEALKFSAIIIIANALLAILPLLGFQRKNDAFYTILTSFYMFTTIRVVLLVFRLFSSGEGSTSIWDTLFSLFIALYAVQGAAIKGIKIGDYDGEENEDKSIEEKLMEEEAGLGVFDTLGRFLSDRGFVLVILGIVLGFHAMQVQTLLGRENLFENIRFTQDADIVVLGYEVNLFVSLVIYIFSLLAFLIVPFFRRYANPEVNRIPWAPPYEELKYVIARIRSGEVSWKGDMAKMLMGMGADKIRSALGRKKQSNEARFSSTWNKLLGRSKKKK